MREAALFFPDYTPEEKMTAYAVLGGMPSYLEQFDPALSVAENARATILRPNTYLAQEPDWLLLEDLRRDVVHGSMLRAVAQGARKPSDIARAIGKDSAQDIGPQLATLQDLGLLVREVPITEKRQARSRSSLYFLSDHYLDFWYRFVDPARSLVAQELGAQRLGASDCAGCCTSMCRVRPLSGPAGISVAQPAGRSACRRVCISRMWGHGGERGMWRLMSWPWTRRRGSRQPAPASGLMRRWMSASMRLCRATWRGRV